MSSIRRLARINKIFGSQMYAQVEETHMGLSTVRLADTGARLTNLYTVGHVEATDTVIVEYGTDGIPYIRPTAVPLTEEDAITVYLEPAPEPEIAIPETPVTVCKLTRQGIQNIPADSSTQIIFDKKLFDPNKIWDGKGMTIEEEGVYLVHTTVALNGSAIYDPNAYQLPSYTVYLIARDVSGVAMWISICKRKSVGTTLVVHHALGMWPLLNGETIEVWIYNAEIKASQNILTDTGKFPILEAWKISKLGRLVRTNGTPF